jgi:hypothetical protein
VDRRLQTRVVAVAQAAIGARHAVTPLDVLTGIGWVAGGTVDRWRSGRAPTIEGSAGVPLEKLVLAVSALDQWASASGLVPSEVEYVGPSQRPLRFTALSSPEVERLFRTQWSTEGVPGEAGSDLDAAEPSTSDLIVIQPLQDFSCAACEDSDDLLVMEGATPLCLACGDLGHLVYLPAGDAALTRRARKLSALSAVVIRFNRSRQRYERQGILVEPAALEQAEDQCLADEELRLRRRERDRERRAEQDVEFAARFAEEIRRLFPSCPSDRAVAIADHAAVRGSGRVGRSAAGRALDERAVTVAVVASVRHLDSDYDSLLMSGVGRYEARDRVRAAIDAVLDRWRTG